MSQSNTDEYSVFQKLCFCGLAVGTAFLGYHLYNKFTKSSGKSNKLEEEKNKRQTPIKKEKQRVNTEYSDYYFDKNMEIQEIEKNLPENPSIQDIYLNSPTISRDQFLKYTKEIRRRRRLIRKGNQDKYIEQILTYENEIQELLTRSRIELVESLNIDPHQFTQMEENYDAVEDLHTLHKQAEKKLKQQLIKYNPVKKMSDGKLKEIINEQIGFVETKMYERIKKKLQEEAAFTQNQILSVVTALQDDIIYEKYGYEWEDIERKLRQGEFDTTERDRCQSKLQADVVAFNYESLDSSKLENSSIGDEELKRSLPTLGISSEIKDKSGDEINVEN